MSAMNEHDSDHLPAPVEPERFEPPASAASWRTLVGAPPPASQGPGGTGATGRPDAPPAAGEPIWDGPWPAAGPGQPAAVQAYSPAAAGGEHAAPGMALDSAHAPGRHDAVPGTLGRVGEEVFAWLKTLASAAGYATLIVTFVFQVARVEGQSMAPTLADQDRLIVNKLAYRLGEPQVGDIVMLYYPLNPEKSFVKRVIAEEGDQIRIVDGRVYRNDVLINDDYVPPEFRSHDDYGPEVVPQGYYFVMGDHRNNSSDSRHWRFVPKKYIIGKVQLRWWPLPEARIF